MDCPILSVLLLLLPFLLFSGAMSDISSNESDDLMIRQVVSNSDDVLSAEQHFAAFKGKFRRTYGTPEENDYRFGIFKANLRRAKRNQLLDPSAVHGVTQFSDLTPAEFQKKYLGLKPIRFPVETKQAPMLPTDDLPTDFDWRDHGAVTAVKDQV